MELKTIQVESLLLDPDNPRLPETILRTQDSMLNHIARSTAIEELMEAIGENGFFLGEAVIAIRSAQIPGKYIVVEGNRRLTAVKLLSNPELCKSRKRVKEIALAASNKPTKLPVAVYDSREEILDYLGNRHIAGVKQWDPFAKARYIAQLFLSTDNGFSFNDRCKEVARRIGSKWNYIAKNLVGIDLIHVLRQNDYFGYDDIHEDDIKFSILTTALDWSEIRDFIEIGSFDDPKINKINTDKYKTLIEWVFVKDKNGETVLGESRNLAKLAKVLSHKEATRTLAAGATLDQAYVLTEGLTEEFLEIIFRVQDDLRRANALAADIDVSEQMEEAVQSIFKQARRLKNAFADHED